LLVESWIVVTVVVELKVIFVVSNEIFSVEAICKFANGCFDVVGWVLAFD